METLLVRLSSDRGDINIVVVYRPPSSKFESFLREFAILIQRVFATPLPFVILGDFNVHVDNRSDPKARKFLDLLDIHNLTQHVSEATNTSGHILDLIITSNHGKTVHINKPHVSDLISDHFAIECTIETIMPSGENTKTFVSRNIKSMDIDRLNRISPNRSSQHNLPKIWIPLLINATHICVIFSKNMHLKRCLLQKKRNNRGTQRKFTINAGKNVLCSVNLRRLDRIKTSVSCSNVETSSKTRL